MKLAPMNALEPTASTNPLLFSETPMDDYDVVAAVGFPAKTTDCNLFFGREIQVIESDR